VDADTAAPDALAGRITPARGPMIMTMRRPSMMGFCSTTATSKEALTT
jgi:hypothetical protein